jgi:hypothetical protein
MPSRITWSKLKNFSTRERSSLVHIVPAQPSLLLLAWYMALDKLGEKMEQVEAVPDGQSLHDVQWFEKKGVAWPNGFVYHLATLGIVQ